MSTDNATPIRDVVIAHLAAFNKHDTDAILSGLDPDVTWVTGSDTIRGRAAMAEVFDDWLWARQPRLDVVRLIVDGTDAAAEAVEHMVVDGSIRRFPIAIFFTVRRGRLATVTVFRGGSADLLDA